MSFYFNFSGSVVINIPMGGEAIGAKMGQHDCLGIVNSRSATVHYDVLPRLCGDTLWRGPHRQLWACVSWNEWYLS